VRVKTVIFQNKKIIFLRSLLFWNC